LRSYDYTIDLSSIKLAATARVSIDGPFERIVGYRVKRRASSAFKNSMS